jgi:hypothetical protein
MAELVTVEMMSPKTILWRCLHSGPLTAASVDQWDRNGEMPWAEFRARNLPLLSKLSDIYGACAVVAKDGDLFVGHLRFYPKAVCDLAEPGPGLCLQQEFPSGPSKDFWQRRFPLVRELKEKTLFVHCMMVASGGPGGQSYRQKGIGIRMARALIGWAMVQGWQAIEATAYEDLPIIYAISGQAGRAFWKKLGFRLVRTESEPALAEENDFVRKMREEAGACGLEPGAINNKYIMRLDLN